MIGQTLTHYRILEQIGAGGMGEVYRAIDTRLDRPVAVKVLPDALCTDGTALRRFMLEARHASALNHPNICTIHDIGEHAGRPFMVLECLAGRTLENMMSDGPLALDELLDLAGQLCAGLGAAHSADIIHRDLKPANIYVTDTGLAKILDFGVAKYASDCVDFQQEVLTQPGWIVGTPFYMSPEQALGQSLDPRTDLFSLGLVLYEMATGCRPFAAPTPAAAYDALLNRTPHAPSRLNDAVPAAFDDVIEKLLEKALDQRYQSADAVMADLNAVRPTTRTQVAPVIADGDTDLAQARRAFEHQVWGAALAGLRQADDSGELGPEDLERLGWAAFWTRQEHDCSSSFERAHTAYLEQGRPIDAARVAAVLAEEKYTLGAVAVAKGWLQRADKLLSDQPESVAHGYVARARARIVVSAERDPDRGEQAALAALAIAERFGDADLRVLAMQDRGRALVFRGEVEAGFELIDESMAAATAGELSPHVVGKAYCNMIDMCEMVGDYRRAGEWSERGGQWSETHDESVFPGLCSVHRAEVMRVRGEWDQAVKHAERAVDAHTNHYATIAAHAYYVIGEVKLRRGEFDDAEAAFRRGHELGRSPVPGLALLRLAQGRVDAAQSLMRRAVTDESALAVERIRLLPASVEISVAAGELDTARAQAVELRGLAAEFESSVFDAASAQADGAVCLADDDLEGAVAGLRKACGLWRDSVMPYDEARARLVLAHAYWRLEDADHADLEASAACSVFRRLGAAHDLGVAEALLAELPSG